MTADEIPFEVIAASHTAVLGKTGSGKTSTAKLLVEHLFADDPGARVCILDPIKSDWYGLTTSADGEHPGLPFAILGGPRAHVPLQATAGAVIGRLVGRRELPLSIIDMASFGPGGDARFFCDFADALLASMEGVVHLVMEEAHVFAPKERSGIGNENLAIHWAKRLATAGRSRGVRLILATQRTQSLHNALLGSCETLIAHRLTTPADQKPVIDWLRANVDRDVAATVAGSLSSLRTGEAWVCSGEARIFERLQFPKIATFDNSATPTADSTMAGWMQGTLVDIGRLKALLGEAGVEMGDPSGPKTGARRIDLAAVERSAERAGYDRGLAEGEVRGRRQMLDHIKLILGAVGPDGEVLRTGHGDIPLSAALPAGATSAAIYRGVPPKKVGEIVNLRPAPSAETVTPDRVRPHQKVLDALAWWAAAGFPEIQRPRAAIVAGYSPRASTFGVYISELVREGLVRTAGPGLVALTEAGAAKTVARSGSAIQSARAMLTGAENNVFDVLVRRREWIERGPLADLVGLSRTASTLGVYLSKLSAFGFVEVGRGRVRAAPWLFPPTGAG